MPMRVTSAKVAGVLVIDPDVFGDSRGSFFEAWHQQRYEAHGVTGPFVQDNVSRSTRGTLRGLHVQEPFGQAKLVQVLDGEVFDVAVDVRVGSPSFGQWVGERLSSENHRQMFIPVGWAHGFCVLSESALLSYKCTELYHPETEVSVAWNDPEIGIAWPVSDPLLSKKDAAALRLREVPVNRLPAWQP